MKINSSTKFYFEDGAFSGVCKIAEKVMHDVELVVGVKPEKMTGDLSANSNAGAGDVTAPVGIAGIVIFGTIGKSAILEKLSADGKINLSEITGKREVYSFTVFENQIVIAGSDKRGTIYGLFHLSELIGVSPLVDWADLLPEHKDEIELTEKDNLVSKEPSVRFRGFFINDEWPAFGNWSNKNFGGVNAKCYEHVFELLLRMKGNYLWPAMWASRFSDDGPGLANAELADELGVVMGASHHEPCCRAGEEYRHLRGPGSIYGDAWNFTKNRDGITKFWEDGLKRNGKFENVITVGMRGEADTAIMKNATLKDNIDLLRDVLKTQNRLIRENVNPNIEEVPRMLALYKEVEPYFYGDKHTKGLMGDPELDGVTLMLCDDNHGNLRTVPTKEMRNHKGGYGMYYHFDYHGWPYSYEWVNTSYLPKVKEQMSAAYDFGIRDLWIVNVGDIATIEFPLNYFLDLAYDYDKYSDLEFTTEQYTKNWVEFNFAGLSDEQKSDIEFVILNYTKLAHLRRVECIKPDTFHPVNYGESDMILSRAEEVMAKCESLKKSFIDESGGKNPATDADKIAGGKYTAFFEQVYYPAMGTMNVLKMQLLLGKNHWYANHGIMAANALVPKIKECLDFDKSLVAEVDSVDGGKFYAEGWSEHFGFNNWCEEENSYPVYMTVEGARKKRLIAWVDGDETTTCGLPWSGKKLFLNDFQHPDVDEAIINLASGSANPVSYKIECDKPWLKFSATEGEITDCEKIEKIKVTINRDAMEKDSASNAIADGEKQSVTNIIASDKNNVDGVNAISATGDVNVKIAQIKITSKDNPAGRVCIRIEVNANPEPLVVSIEAGEFIKAFPGIDTDGNGAEFKELVGYGKTVSAMKVFPVTSYFKEDLKSAPCLEYSFNAREEGIYKIDFFMNPSNPATKDNYFKFGAGVNGKDVLVDVVDENFAVGDNQYKWGNDITNNIRICSAYFDCKKGANSLKVYAVTPNFVLEKIVVSPNGFPVRESYLGAK